MHTTHKNHRLHKLVTMAGRIWNHCVAFHKTYFRLYGGYCGKRDLKRHLAKVRNRTKEWMIVGAQSVQDVVDRIDGCYQKFFAWVRRKNTTKHGKPRFKSCVKYPSVTFTQNGWSYLGGNKIRIGKHHYKFIKTREIEGKIKTCTIKRDNMNRFWVVFAVEQEDPVTQATGSINTAGFDFGLKKFLTLDSGTSIESPLFFKAGAAEIKRCNRALASKQKGSNNRKKAKHQLSRANERIANRRRDWFFKLAHDLCDRFDTLYFETLNIQGMQRLWGRKISDLGFASFLEILKWVAFKRGRTVKQIGKWEPTSKTCSHCGHVQDMPLSVRVFDCGGCHVSIDRDVNAALNIKRLGHQADGLGSVGLGFDQATPV